MKPDRKSLTCSVIFYQVHDLGEFFAVVFPLSAFRLLPHGRIPGDAKFHELAVKKVQLHRSDWLPVGQDPRGGEQVRPGVMSESDSEADAMEEYARSSNSSGSSGGPGGFNAFDITADDATDVDERYTGVQN